MIIIQLSSAGGCPTIPSNTAWKWHDILLALKMIFYVLALKKYDNWRKNTIKQIILDINIIIIFILVQYCLFRYGQFEIFGIFWYGWLQFISDCLISHLVLISACVYHRCHWFLKNWFNICRLDMKDTLCISHLPIDCSTHRKPFLHS